MSNIYAEPYSGGIDGAVNRADTSVALDGSGTGLRITSTANAQGDTYLHEPAPGFAISVSPATQYTSRVEILTAQTSRTGQLIIDYYDISDVQIGGASAGADVALTVGVATLVSITDTSPAGAVHMRVWLRFKTPTTTQTWLALRLAVNTGSDTSFPAVSVAMASTLDDDDQE